MTPKEKSERLDEIRNQIKDLVYEARDLLRHEGITWDRANSYWYAHILMALDKEHDYLGSSMVTMEDTIYELDYDEEEEE